MPQSSEANQLVSVTERAGWARGPIVAALLVFLTCGYFQNTRPGWNVNSQFALTCAIVERHTFRIDDYHKRPEFLTNDKAFVDGHFYTDKSPVTPFLGVPAFFVYSQVCKVLDRP